MTSEIMDLNKITCCNCHVPFWVLKKHKDNLLESKKSFYCPSGHSQSYQGKSHEEELAESQELTKKYKRWLANSEKNTEEYFKENKKLKKELENLKPKDKDDKKTKTPKNPEEKEKSKKKK